MADSAFRSFVSSLKLAAAAVGLIGAGLAFSAGVASRAESAALAAVPSEVARQVQPVDARVTELRANTEHQLERIESKIDRLGEKVDALGSNALRGPRR